MAIIGNDRDALFHGLSDFWRRMFNDAGDLQALYEGTEVLLGQAYLDLLSDVLNAAVVETPLFRKEYYNLIVLNHDPAAADPLTFALDKEYQSIAYLQDRVFAPTNTLEPIRDYTVNGSTITFTTNPFVLVDGAWTSAHAGFAFRDLNGTPQLMLWAVDAQVDTYELYYRLGHLFSDKTRSSEAYRMFVRGIMQLYLLGPALERLESALNVVAGMPVVRSDGERITAVDGAAVKPSVTTDRNVYVFPTGTRLRLDLLNATNLTLLPALRVFEPLTESVQVTDYLQQPSWWHHITIPEPLMPGAPLANRVVSPLLAENRIGYDGTNGYARIGDPGFVIGPALGYYWHDGQYISEETFLPPTELPVQHRQRASFIIMDKFLKTHLFSVVVDQAVGDKIGQIVALLKDAKPTHTDFYLSVGASLALEEIGVGDVMNMTPWVMSPEPIHNVDNRWQLGDGLNIGDRFFYDGTGTPILSTLPTSMPVVLGGQNPFILPDPTKQSIMDRPVAITVTEWVLDSGGNMVYTVGGQPVTREYTW